MTALPTLQLHLAPLSTIEVALAATFVDLGIWDLVDVDAWMCSKVSWEDKMEPAYQQGVAAALNGWERLSPYTGLKAEKAWYAGYDSVSQ